METFKGHYAGPNGCRLLTSLGEGIATPYSKVLSEFPTIKLSKYQCVLKET